MPNSTPYQSIYNAISSLSSDALVRVVYVSMLTLTSRLNPTVLDDLAHKSTRNNKANGITGVLSYGKGAFLQCLEGRKSQVLPMLERIFNDKRHKDIKILMCKPIEERYFTNWSMRMLFLEKWVWSANTKKQSNQMLEFLPFQPYQWSPFKLDRFIDAIQIFEVNIKRRDTEFTYSTLGQLMQRVAGPHQAFILVQGVLAIMIIISLIQLYKFI